MRPQARLTILGVVMLLVASCAARKQVLAPGCREAVTRGSFTLPAHAAYANWVFAAPGATSLEYVVQVHDDPGEDVGLYLSLANTTIDGAQFYLGLQTNLAKPKQGWVGRGLLFSSWGTFDADDTRLAAGGYRELGTHEGRFAGVRLTYPWTRGTYRVRLTRGEGDARGDWFELFITDERTSKQTFIGAIRFRRKDPTTPATIKPNNTTFLEVYSEAREYDEVPAWNVSVSATADGVAATSARSEYPAWPGGVEFPNTDVSFEGARVVMRIGGETPRCHAAGPLFP